MVALACAARCSRAALALTCDPSAETNAQTSPAPRGTTPAVTRGGPTRTGARCSAASIRSRPVRALASRFFSGIPVSSLQGGRSHSHTGGQNRRNGAAHAMFTGIVEEMGTVCRLEQAEDDGSGKVGWTLEVEAQETLKEAKLGDSISVNGTCLTITTLTPSTFTFGLAPETLRCTSLGELQAGSAVNLERSMRPDGRMGGHFVQGHVDATGTIAAFWEEGDSLWVRVKAPADLMPYIVPKGYIAVDGTSLTVCDVNDSDSTFTFMLVAYTQQKIVVPKKLVGNKVNLEVDILGKYVARMMTAFRDAGRIPASA